MTKSGVPNSLRLGSTLGEMAMLPLLLTQLTGYGLYDLPQTQGDLSVHSKNSLGCWSIRRFIFKFKTILKDLTTGDWTQMKCLCKDLGNDVAPGLRVHVLRSSYYWWAFFVSHRLSTIWWGPYRRFLDRQTWPGAPALTGSLELHTSFSCDRVFLSSTLEDGAGFNL